MTLALKLNKLTAVFAGILIIAAMTAASCDWHRGFHFHQNCVLCQLAQLAVILTAAMIALPPPDVVVCGIAPAAIFQVETPNPPSHLSRAPPA